MRKLIFVTALMVFAAIPSRADKGHLEAFRIAVGSSPVVTATALTATSTASIVGSRTDRPDVTCFNNSPNYIYVSSNTGTLAHVQQRGFIMLSSATFSLGAFLGDVIAVTSTGAGEVRCWEGRTP